MRAGTRCYAGCSANYRDLAPAKITEPGPWTLTLSSPAALLGGGGGGAAWRRSSSQRMTPTCVSLPAPRVLSSSLAGSGAQKPVHSGSGSAARDEDVSIAPAVITVTARNGSSHCRDTAARIWLSGSVSPSVCIISSPRTAFPHAVFVCRTQSSKYRTRCRAPHG